MRDQIAALARLVRRRPDVLEVPTRIGRIEGGDVLQLRGGQAGRGEGARSAGRTATICASGRCAIPIRIGDAPPGDLEPSKAADSREIGARNRAGGIGSDNRAALDAPDESADIGSAAHRTSGIGIADDARRVPNKTAGIGTRAGGGDRA